MWSGLCKESKKENLNYVLRKNNMINHTIVPTVLDQLMVNTKSTEFSEEQWEDLFLFARDNEIKLFSSVFDETSSDLINNQGAELFKIGSAKWES